MNGECSCRKNWCSIVFGIGRLALCRANPAVLSLKEKLVVFVSEIPAIGGLPGNDDSALPV